MKSTQLYLDTARLGQMSQGARQAHLDFAHFAGEEGASLLFERFLRDGSEAWPSRVQPRFPGLACWKGIAGLKESLRTLARSNPSLPVLLANRLTNLMQFASRLLFHPCRNVLVTDLGWPPYREILESEAQRAGRLVTSVALRTLVGDQRTVKEDVVEVVRERFLEAGCDGLFLTAISHHGFRLPVERIVRALECVRELRFVVIDGAQDFCHAAADLSNEYCDLYLAGCHKWLQGFHPMGLGFYGRQSSRDTIETMLEHLLVRGELDDPLLRFSRQLESFSLDSDTETVNLIPLFTCQGAAAEALDPSSSLPTAFRQRQENLALATSVAESCGWQSALPASPFRTGVLLLQAERSSTRNRSARDLRETFAENGVALTAYEGGFIRLSMPATAWNSAEINHLSKALRAIA